MDDQPSPGWMLLRWPAVLLVAVVAYGTIGYMLVEGFSLLDALYMTSLVLSTVGFREVQTLEPDGKAFTITLIILGVGTALVTISLAARWVVEVNWPARARRKRMERQLERLHDHVIVCAFGRVGKAVVTDLRAAGVPFVVVDSKQELEPELAALGVPYLVEDPSSEAVLRRAGVERARGLVSAVDSDATNVYITLTARTMNPRLFIVARASDEAAVERLRRAGADRVVSPYASSGRHMAGLMLRPQAEDFIEVSGARAAGLKLVEMEIEDHDGMAGRSVSDVAAESMPLVLRRSDGALVPSPAPDLRLSAGDVLILLEQEDRRSPAGSRSGEAAET